MLRLKHLGKHQHRRGDRAYLGSKKKPTAKFPRLFKFFSTVIISFIFTLVFSGISLWQSAPALATPVLTIQPISWNVVGLDSNNVNVGPNTYMVGARVCNIGTTAATNVTATFVRDGAINSLINLQGSSTLTLASLPAGTTSQPPGNTGATPNNCTDFYYNVVITRNSAAYNTSQMYHIEASATGVGTISTPLNREIYVEKLISQNRNSVLSITGPTTVTVGQTYQYTVRGTTATNGYEQLVFSPNFPNILFQVIASTSTYDAPAGTGNNAIYADACGWDPIIGPTPPQGTYRSCKGPYNYPGGKAGGNVTTVYTVKVLSAGTATITNLIYDFSGSSYHYNSDLGTGVNAITITAVPPSNNSDLQIVKSHTGNFALNQNSNYNLTVSNVGLTASSGTITVTDTLPTGLTYVSASGTAVNSNNWSCSATGQTVTCTNTGSLAANASSTINLTVKPTTTGTVTNTATVTNTNDTNNANNSSSDPTIINDLVDLSITKTDGLTTINPSSSTTISSITYTVTVTNLSKTISVDNAPVTDDVPTAITNVSWTCSTSGGGNSCGAASGTGNSISTTVTLAKNGGTATFTVTGTVSATATGTLSNTANVTAPSGISDPTPSNNTATDTTNVNAPDLTISKTHSTNISYNQNGVFTLTVTNIGFATTSGTITVTDTLPTGLTYVSASGTAIGTNNWSCSFTSPTVTCTNNGLLAASASSSINLTVKRTTQDIISNTATVSNTSDKNSNNNSSTDVLPATTRLRLVKRITRINTIAKTGYIDNPSDANDDSTLMWPTPLSTYLQGVINGGNVKPGDLIEYTVYFLSDGGTPAQNVTLCDLVPFNSTFLSTAFNTNSGIAMALSTSSLPTAPTNYFTNIADTDAGQLYIAGTTLPAACASNTNPNGAVVVKVVSGATTVPNATAPGTPTNSYGFIRFVSKIN